MEMELCQLSLDFMVSQILGEMIYKVHFISVIRINVLDINRRVPGQFLPVSQLGCTS